MRRARDLGASTVEVLPPLSKTMLAQRQFDELLAMDVSGLSDSGQVTVLTSQGAAEISRGNLETAQSLIDEALVLQPDSVYALMTKAGYFAARSELYENSFMEYAVPQAILRLRQRFGRLIRTKSDRGVAVILDQRVVSRRYGKAFLNSLPPGTIRTCSLFDLDTHIKNWMGT